MIVRVTKKTAKRKVKALKKISSKRKSIDLDKYFGKINFGTDGLTYQKRIRKDE